MSMYLHTHTHVRVHTHIQFEGYQSILLNPWGYTSLDYLPGTSGRRTTSHPSWGGLQQVPQLWVFHGVAGRGATHWWCREQGIQPKLLSVSFSEADVYSLSPSKPHSLGLKMCYMK